MAPVPREKTALEQNVDHIIFAIDTKLVADYRTARKAYVEYAYKKYGHMPKYRDNFGSGAEDKQLAALHETFDKKRKEIEAAQTAYIVKEGHTLPFYRNRMAIFLRDSAKEERAKVELADLREVSLEEVIGERRQLWRNGVSPKKIADVTTFNAGLPNVGSAERNGLFVTLGDEYTIKLEKLKEEITELDTQKRSENDKEKKRPFEKAIEEKLAEGEEIIRQGSFDTLAFSASDKVLPALNKTADQHVRTMVDDQVQTVSKAHKEKYDKLTGEIAELHVALYGGNHSERGLNNEEEARLREALRERHSQLRSELFKNTGIGEEYHSHLSREIGWKAEEEGALRIKKDKPEKITEVRQKWLKATAPEPEMEQTGPQPDAGQIIRGNKPADRALAKALALAQDKTYVPADKPGAVEPVTTGKGKLSETNKFIG